MIRLNIETKSGQNVEVILCDDGHVGIQTCHDNSDGVYASLTRDEAARLAKILTGKP